MDKNVFSRFYLRPCVIVRVWQPYKSENVFFVRNSEWGYAFFNFTEENLKMKRKFKISLSTLFALALVINVVTLPAFAAELTYTPSSSYSTSDYYTALRNVTLTGDQRSDLIAVARSQVGYREGSCDADLSGWNDGSHAYNNYCEYNYWFWGGAHNGGSSYPWCATFVSWCARQAGIPTSILRNSSAAGHSASYFNIPYYSGSSYTPKPGDLFFTTSWTHVGIVTGVNGNEFYTIEGNTNNNGSSDGNGVYARTRYGLSNYYFGAPNYTNIIIEPSPSYADLGTDFCAIILNTKHWKTISLEDDQSVKIRPEDGTSKQVWKFVRQSDGSYLILSAKTGKALELYNGETSDGTLIKACGEDWGGNYQRWYLYQQGDGYCIVSKHYADTKNVAMDMTAAAAYDGTSVIGFKRYNGESQIWSIYRSDEIQLRSPVSFSVNAKNSLQNTTFTWDDVYGETGYSLKIWKAGVPSENAFKEVSDAKNGCEVNLPAGDYSAYVDAYNYFGWKQSNIVDFTVTPAYTVSYNSNGGTGIINSQVKENGIALTISTIKPTRSGYTFKNWNTKADGTGTSYASGSNYTVNANVTLYAQWERAFYTIIYDTNGGVENGWSNSCEYGKSTNISTIVPTRDKYKFVGWSKSKNATTADYLSGDEYSENQNAVLYAVWKVIPYTNTEVTDYGAYKLCSVSLSNIEGTPTIIVATYKAGKLLGIERRVYSKENETFAVFGDIDSVKIMVWDDTSAMIPITKTKEILSTDFKLN